MTKHLQLFLHLNSKCRERWQVFVVPFEFYFEISFNGENHERGNENGTTPVQVIGVLLAIGDSWKGRRRARLREIKLLSRVLTTR